MPASGVEPKPPWRAVPSAVRRKTEELLGARVERALRVWGGYAPTATFRLRLADGRRAFFKGINRTSNERMRWALAREEQVYRDLGDLIAPWAPRFHGSFRHDDWHVLLLEDLGPASVPPWTTGKARAIARAYAEFHRSTLGKPLPDWLTRRESDSIAESWGHLAAEPGGLESLAALAGPDSGPALVWLSAALPALRRAAEEVGRIPPPDALLHFDTRSDNLRLTSGRLRLFDWPFASVGPAEMDAAGFAQSVTCEGGPGPEQVMSWYRERLPLREEALDASVAAIAGYFADRAWRPGIPGLPRVRSIQRCQLRVSLAWAARRLGQPEPHWLAAVQT